jgi:hypothetical protein
MKSAMRVADNVRLAAVLASAAFALHQLRYLIAFGDSTSTELARQGHGYMADALPVLLVIGISIPLATLVRARLGGGVAGRSLPQRAVLFAAIVLSIYVAQESAEGLLAAGHPTGPGAALASGGWMALPLAAGLGICAAILFRLLEGVELALAKAWDRRGLPRASRIFGRSRPEVGGVRLRLRAPLAFGLARRPPPPLDT